jgi:hypothetical protein
MAAVKPTDQLAAPTQPIGGRYLVEELLGRGGMATVYRARDLRSGAQLALKRGFARDERKLQQRAALLEREYHTLVQLAHPSIIEVYDYGVDEHGPYYTMELLEGADLSERQRTPWREVCAILRDIASSLSILHSRGLIHRDVSTSNVRRTNDGRAKLIDFGAMVSFGVAKEVVGTAPFMAPEVLQLQELDGRADLFSLGALGYFMLTGRHAYPARRLVELRDVWRSRPAPPSRLVGNLPSALSELVMQLVTLDRSARPPSAAEVMERLCAIDGSPLQEGIEVSRAYLTSPTLVGRDDALLKIRRRMLALVRGDGGTVLIDGVSGSGRSRMLDATALEGKLLGATVLRADAGDGSRGEWGVARALGTQLQQFMPDETTEAARLSRDVLGHVLESLRSETTVSSTLPERSLLIRTLRDFMFSIARVQRLLIVVDDVDKIDDASAALLAAIAHKVDRQPLSLALSLNREESHAQSAPLRFLRSVAEVVAIEPLDAAQTEALMRSVFGDVANLSLLANRVHSLSQGNPRAAIELAQHLVDRGLARYQAGSWSLPPKLSDAELPTTLTESLARRLATLSPTARALADALCLAEAEPLVLEQYPALLGNGAHAAVFRALDELVAARVLSADGDRYGFSQRGFVAVIEQELSPERRQAVHRRIADILAQCGGDVLRRVHHLLHGGHGREAVELLESINLQARLPPVAVLEQAIAEAERHHLSPRTIHQLRTALLSRTSLVLAVDSFRRCLPPVLAQLEHDSGLALHRELSELPPDQRLQQALARTQASYLATPDAERVYPVVDAIRELARVSGACSSFYMQLLDLESLESLPSLEPLAPLSPSLAVVASVLDAGRAWQAGRFLRARALYQQVFERIGEPDRAGLDDAQHKRTRLGLHFLLGLFEAGLSNASAERHAAALERESEYRVNAWRIRMLLQLGHGNIEEARNCQRRAELSALQDAGDQRYLGMGANFEVGAYADAGDLLGVKSLNETLGSLAERYPRWRVFWHYGQCRYRWLQGDLPGALEAALAGLALALPGRHLGFACLAGAHVRLLCELGRIDEAVSHGRRYRDLCQSLQLLATDHAIGVGLALALARAGEHAEAVSTIEAVISDCQSFGSTGLLLGTFYETRARIAILMADRPAFERFCELCALEYKKAKNPMLSASFARLLDDARQQALTPTENPALRELFEPVDSEVVDQTVHHRMLECIDAADRARCALTLLLESTESCVGYLFGVRDGAVAPIAGLPDVLPDEGLAQWVEQRAKFEVEQQVGATITDEGDGQDVDGEIPLRFTDGDGRCFEAIPMISPPKRQSWLVAMLAVQVTPGPRTLPPRPLLGQIAGELLADVSGVEVEGPAP